MKCVLTIKISDGLKRVFYLPDYGAGLQLLKCLELGAHKWSINSVRDIYQKYEIVVDSN